MIGRSLTKPYPAGLRALPATPAKSAKVAQPGTPFLLALILVAIFIPEAFGFFFADFRFTIASALILVTSPYVLFAFGQKMVSSTYRFVASDFLVPAAALWMIVAPAITDGLDRSIKPSGLEAMTLLVPYAIARSQLRDRDGLHAAVRLFCVLAGIAGLLSVLDPLTNQHLLRGPLAQLTGYKFYNAETSSSLYYRFGLLRAQGPFEHAILLGVIMCYALILSRDLSVWARTFCQVGCGMGLFTSLSAAPWQAFVLGSALLIYGNTFRWRHKWVPIGAGATALAAVLFLVLPDPLGWILNHFTVDAINGYYRLLVWHYAGDQVLHSPIFGIGVSEDWFRPEWMPTTVDSIWLRLAMKYGIPGSVMIAMALIGSGRGPVRVTDGNSAVIDEREGRLAEALGIIVFLTIYLGFTVYFWGSAWILVGLVAGCRAHLANLAAQVSDTRLSSPLRQSVSRVTRSRDREP